MAATIQSDVKKQSAQLITADSVIKYLSETPFKSSHADVLFGGTANFIYRAHLITPYLGKFNTVVVKHDQPYVKNLPSLAFSVERQKIEAEALKRIRTWVDENTAGDSLVTVPEIYFHDEENCTIIMEDCGTEIVTLKDFLMSSSLDAASALAPSVGSHLGAFIAQMHNWSRANPDGLLDFFQKNELGKGLSAWVTHGRVVETLNGTAKLPRLEDPPFRIKEEDLKAVGEVAGIMQSKIKTANDLFVMGDFYPGNIMVVPDSAPAPKVKKIYIFDWELAKSGVPGVELGQFCAEMIQLQRFAKDSRRAESVAHLVDELLSEYASVLRASGDPAINDTQLIQDTLIHCGSHLIAWTPRTPSWEDKEICRKVVSEGVDFMINGYKGEEGYLKQSFAKGLM